MISQKFPSRDPSALLQNSAISKQIWEWLIQPSKHITDPVERMRAELIATSTLFFTLLTLTGNIASALVVSGNSLATVLLTVLTTVTLLAYILSRTSHYHASGPLNMSVWTIATLAYVYSGRTTDGPAFAILNLIPFGFILGYVLLQARSLLVIVIVNVAGVLLLPLFEPGYMGRLFYTSAGVLFAMGGLTLIAQRHRDQIERVRLKTISEANRELALIGNVRTAMAQELDLPALLRSVVESVADSFGYTLVSLYLIDEEALILQHQVGYERVISRIVLTEGVSGRVVRSGKPVFLADVRTDPDFLGAIGDLVSEICVPLFDAGRVVGTLNVESTQGIKLTEADLKLLTALSDHVGIAIGRARLYSDLQRRNRILSALENSTLVLMKKLDLTDALQTILSQASQLLGAAHGYIYLVEPDEMTIKVILGMGIFSGNIGKTLNLNEGIAGKVWFSGQPLYVPDYHAWEGRSPQFEDIPFHAVLGVPLTAGERVVGVLGLAHLEPGPTFSSSSVDLLSRFAQLASIAFENARLYTVGQFELAERKRLEGELQAERDFALQVIRTMGQGVTVTDENGQFVLVNPAYARFMGYKPDELIGKTPDDLTLPEAKGKLVEAREARQQGATTTYESALLHKDGGKVPVLITGSPRIKGGSYVGAIASITDLTEIKRVERERENLISELSAKNDELERFTYTVSHDLKSPLFTIRGFLGYLQQDVISGDLDRLNKDIQRIADATDKMQHLLNDLLELSRIGRLMNEPQKVHFESLVRDVLELLHGQLHERGVRVVVQENLPDVIGDRQRLLEVLQNLIENSVKFMSDQNVPVIEIGTKGMVNQKPVFFVGDNGMGIPPGQFERIFGLFNKLDPRTSGTGIGLALVRRIIEFHGGRIWVESEAGRGSTFFFTLPSEALNNSVI